MGKNLTTSEPDIYKLAVFDFDETLVDDELSDYILNSGKQQSKIIVPCEINAIYEAWNWPFRMNALFKFLRNNHDITSADIIKHVAKIRVSDSLKELIRLLKSNNYKLVIISDCNSLFIDTVLKSNGLENMFSNIFTNSASIDQNGVIRLKAFYQNILDSSNCPCEICSRACALPSICKMNVLANLLKTSRADASKQRVVYVGDGSNDLCAVSMLKEGDYVFAREGYALASLLKSGEVNVCAKVNYWTSGEDIIKQLGF